jgi:hypothetical protein
VTAKGIANHAKINQLGASQGLEVPVVNEFVNVFPEELPVCRLIETSSL